jgi:hypothetical protein
MVVPLEEASFGAVEQLVTTTEESTNASAANLR